MATETKINTIKDPHTDYQQRLQDIDLTAQTTQNVVGVLSNGKTVVSLLILIAGVLLICVLFKSQLLKFWEWLTAPIAEAIGAVDANAKAKQETGSAPEITDENAKELCIELGNCFNRNGDNEEAAVAVIKKIHTYADWVKANRMFGTLDIKCRKWLTKPHTHSTMEDAINCNLRQNSDAKHRKRMISHLKAIGVPADKIHILS